MTRVKFYLKQILDLIPRAFERYTEKRIELNFKTETNIYFYEFG